LSIISLIISNGSSRKIILWDNILEFLTLKFIQRLLNKSILRKRLNYFFGEVCLILKDETYP